ncbi:MAG: F0F1 ATP synthase subunit A [Planctomycetota bacterium]|nr:F0F1 ATP synthase subunit A [Planctomycetota bacterium]
MADPVLHIKDSYYFEVPKFMWRRDWKSLEDIPESLSFVKNDHPHATIKEINSELSGKIVIEQPFGTLDNLYQMESGIGISKFMIIEVVVATIIAFIFIRLAARYREGDAPKGKLWNLFESFLVYLRDSVVRPAIAHDPHHYHEADKFLPVLWTLFFFILGCNLMGMIPWLGSPTGTFSATLALAAITLLTVLVSGSLKFGVVGFWKNQVPAMDLPIALAVILKPIIFVIEVVGLFIRHAILAVRLLANMAAGHLVILGIMGLITGAAALSLGSWGIVTAIAVIGTALFSLLELFVAFLQAYIFTFLSALFIGAAVNHH